MSANTQISQLAPQFQPAPFVFAGRRLGHLRGGQAVGSKRATALVVIDRDSLRTELTIELERGHGIGALSDGTIAVLEDKPIEELSFLSAKAAKLTAKTGSLLKTNYDRRSRLLGGGAATELISAADGSPPFVQWIDVSQSQFSVEASAELRLGNDFDGLAALGDGSVVFGGSGVVERIWKSGKRESYKTDFSARHVVAGPTPSTVWVSESSESGGLHLLELGDPMVRKAKVAGWIYHLASAGEQVAALVADPDGGQFELVAWDASGTEEWRTPLPAKGGDLNRAPAQWVAASKTQIALATTEAVTVFDAKTGKKLTP